MIRRKKSIPVLEDPIDISLCLAKTEESEGRIIPGVSVLEHSLLSGRVAECLSSNLITCCSNNLFPRGFNLLVALHDIGKISLPFQLKLQRVLSDYYENNEEKRLSIKDNSIGTDIKHDQISLVSLLSISEKIEAAIIVGSHHGHYHSSGQWQDTDRILGGDAYSNARKELFKELSSIFGCDLPDLDKSLEKIDFLTGLTIVSDWISSSISKQQLLASDVSVSAYNAVKEKGFRELRIKENLSFSDIFGFDPRECQKTFYDTVKAPGVYTLEVEMGQGKTEAALYAAYKLLSEKKADGIYFALPSRLTSKQMHTRMTDFVNKIVDDSYKTRLAFSGVFFSNGACSPEYDWFDNRKRVILDRFGVGTIDQALMSVINVKHSSVRTFGLAGKVVIIDELHSYDIYTSSLILALISQLRKLGCTIIILSATLQSNMKKQINGYSGSSSESYPLISCSDSLGFCEIPIKPTVHKKIDLIHSCTDDSLEKALDAAYSGNYVLWIENTVDEALYIYRILKARCANEIEIGIIHSRFMDSDRSVNESYWVSKFGKKGKRPQKGSLGCILIGTQVLEQSLDIDADIIFTRLAPVDMLIQRIGRLWRHSGNNGFRNCINPVCYLMETDFDDLRKDFRLFGPSGAVYSPYILYRTQKELQKRASVIIPDDIRGLLESVYCEMPFDCIEEEKAFSVMEERKRKLSSMVSSSLRKTTEENDDENASTRFSEIEYVDVLLLSSIDYSLRTVKLLSGEFLDLKENQNIHDKAQKLRESIVSVPVKRAPFELNSEEEKKMFRKFLYISKDMVIAVVDEDGMLSDIHGNQKNEKQSHYSSYMGYYIDN